MHNLLQNRTAGAVKSRLGKLEPGTLAVWGRMNVTQMLAHCAAQLEMTFGELSAKTRKSPFGRPIVKHALIYFVPWPKGAPTAPELLRPEADQFDAARAELEGLIDRFSEQPEAAFGVHPIFGKLSTRAWGRLAFRHLDHHLRQFGV